MFQVLPANGIDIACEALGDGPPVLMVMCIGAPMVNWPEGSSRDS
jgi:hypothetical protein